MSGTMNLSDIASKPLSPGQLREFFDHVVNKGWPIVSNRNIPKYIILQSYCSLWSGDVDIMKKYFFNDASNMQELKELLKEKDLFGPTYGPRSRRAKQTTEVTRDEYQAGTSQCGHLFKKGESVYRCKNCGVDDTCVMCSKCFHATNHQGHNVKIWISRGGGCCDCGDSEAWKVPLNCSIHSHTSSQQPLEPLPSNVIESIRNTIRVVLDFILETFAAVQENTSKVGTVESIKKRCKMAHEALNLPADNPEQEYRCILWNDETHSFNTVIKALTAAFNMDAQGAHMIAEIVDEFGRHTITTDTNLEALVTRFAPFEAVKLDVSITTSQMESREMIAFYLLSWLKDLTSGHCQFFKNVQDGNSIILDVICQVLSEDWELSPALAHLSTLDRKERQDINQRHDYDEEDVVAEDGGEEQVVVEDVDMLETDLGEFFDHEVEEDEDMSEDSEASLQTADEVLNEETNDLSSVIQVITNEDRELNQPIQRQMPPLDDRKQKDILDMQDRLEVWIEHSAGLKSKEQDDSPDTNTDLRDEFYRKTRLDYLLQFDLRLWKSVRNYIKDILISCFITYARYRPVLGVRYSRNYPELIDALLFKDREPENSITGLSVQILTVPTVSSLLVSKYDFFGMVCTILKNYFPTNEITFGLSEESSHVQIDCLSEAVRRQSFLHVISHLKFLMSTDTVKEEIAKSPASLGFYLDFLYQFQEMDPKYRQEDTHVEFESRAWITAFGLTLQLVKLNNLFADAYQGLDIDASCQLWRSVSRVMKEIVRWKQVLEPREEVDMTRSIIRGVHKQEFKRVAGYNQRIVKYDITEGAVSFHHPLHWLLSKLLQKVSLLDVMLQEYSCTLEEMVHDALEEVKYDYQNAFLLVIEPPIRTIASVAQISCGVWVRNGFGVRDQALLYKETHTRENTLDSDIYLVQVALAICNSDTVLLTLMDRFQILDWFQGKTTNHPCYDKTQQAYMIEEFLNLLVICATEHSLLSGATEEERIRQFIIQYLGLSSQSFSELLKVIPRSLSDHASFEEQLTQLANYKAPEGLADKGLYELKPEYTDSLNPYFWHYTRNQQEEAYHVLEAKGKEFGFKYIKSGPFNKLGKFLHSRVFCQIVAYSLLNHANDTILDLALYLALQALFDPRIYETDLVQFLENDKFGDLTVIDILLQCLDDQKLKHAHKRMELLVDQIKEKASRNVIIQIQQWQDQKSVPGDTQVDDKISDQEKKKAAAKARQAAIMSQFARAQSQFMEQHTDIYDSDQDESIQEDQEQQQQQQVDNGIEIIRKCQFTADTCIVCQEDFDDTKLYGMLGYIQVSNTHRITPLDNTNVLADVLKASACQHPWEREEKAAPFTGFPTDAHVSGLDISSCGHLMHASCFDTYRRSNSNDMLNRLNVTLPLASSAYTRFLCPLCKALGNVLVPVVWTGKKETFPGVMAPSTPYNTICDAIKDVAMDLKKNFEYNINDDQTTTLVTTNDPYLVIRDKERLTYFYNQLMRVTHTIVDQTATTIPMNLPDSLKNMYAMYATTIGDLEIAQRGTTKPRSLEVEHTGTFIDFVPRSSQILLRILSLTNAFIPNLMNSGWQAEDRFTKERLALQAINQFMPDTVTHLIEDMVEADNLKPLLMEDSFHTLVRFSFVVHEMPQIDIHHVLRAMYIAELAKIIIALASNVSASIFRPEHAMKNEEIRHLIQLLNQSNTLEYGIRRFATDVLGNLKFSQNVIEYFFQTVHPGALVALAQLFVLPFIRKAYLFMVLHHGYIPQQATVDTTNELDELLIALNLPLFDTVFDIQDHERELLKNWCHHYVEASDIRNSNSYYLDWRVISLNLPTKYKMVSLPYCMDDLLDESVKRKCSKCSTVPEHSAICLICGTFVCARHFCCVEDDKGECNVHMKKCGGEIGIYIMIKECFLLLLHANGGHIMNAPYLDNHGEADIFFKRGARQYLNEKRYEQFREMWLNQSIPSFVRRRMELQHSSALWETF